ncbi:hypothetical protein NIES2119_32070 [[Phormidium ambiguum] IAM M-71]|uniref:Uncharacterized protein n=1 Tax=[Phormidium ambiguum] IAM M-71 TaxID=454136 RepID=A0A1U7I143_9CYAN|nr:hypothetical protein [Phormidium ambiguum]OKH29620.1 hypothetical protein NIES2119_32070 [Phormidium ambiguum IAM M-71]
MKTDTNQVDLPFNDTAITVVAEPIPTTSELTESTQTEETAIATIQPIESGIQGALQHYGTIINFVQQIFQDGVDFGVIPGTKKPTLYKSGAEKLVKLFGLHHRLELVSKIEDFTGKNYGLDFPLFTYHYKCQLLNKQGDVVAEGEATCSSAEWKYKKQGVQGIWNSQNTICKMSQKRALVAAVLIGVGASEFFTQDLEDMAERVNSEPEHKPQQKTEEGDETRNNLIVAIDNLKTELNWSNLVASKFAEKIVNKKSRSEMLTGELYKLFEAMQAESKKLKK